MRFAFHFAFLAILASGQAASPIRYDLVSSIASVPLSGGASFGSRFYFTSGDQVAYRVIPTGGSEGDPAANWQYWAAAIGGREILPAAGYDSVDIQGISNGQVIGDSSTTTPSRQAALYWTPVGGSITPSGFDLGYSGLNALDTTGLVAGYSDPGTPEVVQWNANTPATAGLAIPLPAGCTSPQVVGVSGPGEVLLYVRDANSVARAAIWNGTTSTLIGPVPTGNFYPANCAINAVGDVVMLVFNPGGTALLHYIPATDRSAWQTFTFDGPVDSSGGYNLHLSEVGVASFDCTINGSNTVAIASNGQRQQFTFAGYRSFLNAAGALVFGNQGNLLYWDAAAWSGQPALVPVSLTTQSGGLDVLGLNADGHLLVSNTLQSTRSLVILAPVFSEPTSVVVRPIRKVLRLTAGQHLRQALVRAVVSGNSLQSSIRFQVRGKIPAGMWFRPSESILVGTPTKATTFTLRIAAIYTADGARQQSAFVKVKVVVRPR